MLFSSWMEEQRVYYGALNSTLGQAHTIIMFFNDYGKNRLTVKIHEKWALEVSNEFSKLKRTNRDIEMFYTSTKFQENSN